VHLPRVPARWGTAGLALGVATAIGHALSYAFSLVLSRALGPADFGALGALLGIAVVASVPATALQTQVARYAAVDPSDAATRQGYRLSWGIGLAQGLALAAAAMPLATLLRLDSGLSVLLLGAGLVPVSLIAARQGTLLGRGAFGLLATTVVLVPALRLAGGAVAAWSRMGVSGALGMQAVATWVGLVLVVLLVRPVAGETRGTGGPASGPRLVGVLAAGASLLGLFVLANVDVLLARALLTDTESGVYAVGALGAKAMFWGSQFVALLVFPDVARRDSGGRVVLLAGLIVTGIGGAATALSVVLAAPVVDLLVGPAYAAAAAVVPWFVVLGTLLALVQLMTYAAVAAVDHRVSVLLWVTVVAESLVIALAAHDSVLEIVAVCIVGTGLLTVASALLVRTGRTSADV
jgi:O-antigen/teichoic acid export membrane protein